MVYHRAQLLSFDHDHTGGELVVGCLGSSRDSLWTQALTARNRHRMVRDGDDVGAGGVTESKRPDTGDDRCRGDDGGSDDHLPADPAAPIDVAGVVGRDSGSGTWRRPNRLAGNDLVVKVSAQINACEISGSAGDSGRVPRSATSPCCKSPEYMASAHHGSGATCIKGDREAMSAQDSEKTTSEQQETATRGDHGTGDQTQEHSGGDVELSEEGRREVHEMVEAYEDKPTVVLPGSHGTITGTAINNWLDDEGNPKFGDPDEHPFAEDRSQSDSDESKETSEDAP